MASHGKAARPAFRGMMPILPAAITESGEPDSKEVALAFLRDRTVRKRLYYVVETPEGNWGPDIDGVYAGEMRLFRLLWQLAAQASPVSIGVMFSH